MSSRISSDQCDYLYLKYVLQVYATALLICIVYCCAMMTVCHCADNASFFFSLLLARSHVIGCWQLAAQYVVSVNPINLTAWQMKSNLTFGQYVKKAEESALCEVGRGCSLEANILRSSTNMHLLDDFFLGVSSHFLGMSHHIHFVVDVFVVLVGVLAFPHLACYASSLQQSPA